MSLADLLHAIYVWTGVAVLCVVAAVSLLAGAIVGSVACVLALPGALLLLALASWADGAHEPPRRRPRREPRLPQDPEPLPTPKPKSPAPVRARVKAEA